MLDLRILQHLLIGTCLVWWRWDWLRVLVCYDRIEALHKTQIDSVSYARQKEALQHRALARVLPLASFYFFVYLTYWHRFDAHYARNEAERMAARIQAPPAGCHLPDVGHPWNWDFHSYIDGILGTHWSEDICADYLKRVNKQLHPSHSFVLVEHAASPFVALMGALGEGLALFLAHQTMLAWGALAMIAAVVFTLGPILAGPYLVLAGVWLRAHNPLQPKVDRFLARRQRAANYIQITGEDECGPRRMGAFLQLESDEYKEPAARRAVRSLIGEEEYKEREEEEEEDVCARDV